METMKMIDACKMCGEFKKVEVITVNGTRVCCCWECEKNMSDEE